jgi:hypothetical protein
MQSFSEGQNYVSNIRDLAVMEAHAALSQVTKLLLVYP